MSVRQNITSILYRYVSQGRLSFHQSIKFYKFLDSFISREQSSSGRYTRKKISTHMLMATSPSEKMAWTSVAFPCELLYPFGIYPVTLEVIVGLLATLGLSSVFLDRADSNGIPNTMCSFHRALLGMADTDFFGRPALVGSTSVLCDGNLKSFGESACMQKVPFLFIDVPYEMSKEAIYYVKRQLEEAISALENICGTALSQEAMNKMVVNTNNAFSLARRFYKMMVGNSKNIYMGHEIANFAFPMYFLLGSEILIDILEEKCCDLSKGFGYNSFYKSLHFDESAKRIMWLHIVPQYSNDLWGVIDDGKKAKIVCDEYSSPYYEDYNIDDPLVGIAKRLISHPSNGPISRRIDNILRIARDYDVDGIVHYSSWGCHQSAGNIQILSRAILDAGYNFLDINGDPVDIRNTSIEQHRTRLEAFLEN